MNIETSKINNRNSKENQNSIQVINKEQIPVAKFADELKENFKNSENITSNNTEFSQEENALLIDNNKNIQIDKNNEEYDIKNKFFEQNITKNISKTEKNINIEFFQDDNISIIPNSNSNVSELENNNVIDKTQEKIQPKITLGNNSTLETELEINTKKDNINNAIDNLTNIVEKLNQSDEKNKKNIKIDNKNDDNNKKGEELINNDININDTKEILPQMTPNMSFNSNSQNFSSFIKDENVNNAKNKKISSTAEDLAEELAIMSTMDENIAIANKKQIVTNKEIKNTNESNKTKRNVNIKTNIFAKPIEEEIKEDTTIKTVTRDNTIKKINTKTNIIVEKVAKLDTIIMNEADVEIFTNLVEKGSVELNNLAPKAAKKSIEVSKTLSDMLAKAIENNKPLRIDFDNNISVIIKISKDGKISAEFLPSSQVAEAYLKENLPLLRQKFDDNNIKYDELNQKERREQKEHNRKKGRDNE